MPKGKKIKQNRPCTDTPSRKSNDSMGDDSFESFDSVDVLLGRDSFLEHNIADGAALRSVYPLKVNASASAYIMWLERVEIGVFSVLRSFRPSWVSRLLFRPVISLCEFMPQNFYWALGHSGHDGHCPLTFTCRVDVRENCVPLKWY